jgi:hypothetical protein
MFEVYCPAHGTHVLLTTSRILVLAPTADGVVVDWRCWCGHHGRSLEGRSSHDRHDRRDGRDGAGMEQTSPELPAAS